MFYCLTRNILTKLAYTFYNHKANDHVILRNRPGQNFKRVQLLTVYRVVIFQSRDNWIGEPTDLMSHWTLAPKA